MMATEWRFGLLVLACVVLPSCGGGAGDAPNAGESDRGDAAAAAEGGADVAAGPAEGRADIAEEDSGGAPEGSSLLEFTGSVVSSGTEGMRMVNLRPDDGSPVGLVGELASELARLSGAVVTVRGNPASAPAARGMEVTEYEVVTVNGETPSVGVLERRQGEYWLGGEPDVHLTGVPDGLAQAVGAKVWVTGSSSADGVRVQSYGIIRPI